MSTSGVSSSSMIRITGMASGLDVDSIVKQMMTAEKVKYNKLVQQKQKAQWTEDAYREQTTLLTGFKSSYFDVLSPLSNMRSPNIYKQFTTTSSSTSVATVTGNSSATAGNHTLTVNQMALTSKLESTNSVSVTSGGGITTTSAGITVSAASPITITAGVNDSLALSLNANQQTIKIPAGEYTSNASLLTAIQAQLDSNFGSGNVSVGMNGSGVMAFNPEPADGTKTVNVLSSNAAATLGMQAKIDLTGGNKFSLTLNATKKDITITVPTDGSYDIMNPSERATFISNLQGSIDSQFGAGNINAVLTSDNRLVFSPNDAGKTLSISDGTLDVSNLRFGGKKDINLNNGISSSSTLASLGVGGTISLKINGVSISIDSSKTISDLMSAVNTSSAKVTMSFNNLTGKFKLETKDSGTASANAFNATVVDGSAKFEDTNGVLAKLGLTSSTGTLTAGQNSQYTLDGVSMSGGSNSFTQDGVTYNLAGIGTTSIGLSQNIDATVTKIKEFVSKYNDLITEIQGKLDDKYNKDYAPLTDDQRSSMTSDDITKWETKAKVGLLHNDSMLKGVLDNMRSALSAPVSGTSSTLSSIGITTGAWYEGGKLNIDETKLRTALTTDIDSVTKLFTNESSKIYNPEDTSDAATANKQQRYTENGVVTRLYDILNDNVRTTQGKGALLTEAGITGDTTEYTNTLYKEIKELTTSISDENTRLSNKETAYYNKFSKLESYMSKMNSQTSALTQQLSKM